jgi:hypothetical protein
VQGWKIAAGRALEEGNVSVLQLLSADASGHASSESTAAMALQQPLHVLPLVRLALPTVMISICCYFPGCLQSKFVSLLSCKHALDV